MVQFVALETFIRNEGDKIVGALDLKVSTIGELPHIGDEVDNYIVAEGTNAQIIQADKLTFVTLDENDTWYPEQS